MPCPTGSAGTFTFVFTGTIDATSNAPDVLVDLTRAQGRQGLHGALELRDRSGHTDAEAAALAAPPDT